MSNHFFKAEIKPSSHSDPFMHTGFKMHLLTQQEKRDGFNPQPICSVSIQKLQRAPQQLSALQTATTAEFWVEFLFLEN